MGVVDIKRTHLKLRMDPTAFKNVFGTVVNKMGKNVNSLVPQ